MWKGAILETLSGHFSKRGVCSYKIDTTKCIITLLRGVDRQRERKNIVCGPLTMSDIRCHSKK